MSFFEIAFVLFQVALGIGFLVCASNKNYFMKAVSVHGDEKARRIITVLKYSGVAMFVLAGLFFLLKR